MGVLSGLEENLGRSVIEGGRDYLLLSQRFPELSSIRSTLRFTAETGQVASVD